MDTVFGSARKSSVSLSLLVLAVSLSQGCLVSQSKYARTQEEKATCTKQLGTCQREREDAGQEAQERISLLEKGNRALLDDLATASAEREELARKLAHCRQDRQDQEEKGGKATDAYQNLAAFLSQEIQEGKIRIDRAESRLKLNLVDKVLFPSGSATLTAKGKAILHKVGNAVKDMRDRKIVIEGHTDDVSISPKMRDRFTSNWDLSALRATAVVGFLQGEVGIDPRLLSAAGYSMYQPLVPNDTPEHREVNRRIEIVLIPMTPAEIQRLPPLPKPEAP